MPRLAAATDRGVFLSASDVLAGGWRAAGHSESTALVEGKALQMRCSPSGRLTTVRVTGAAGEERPRRVAEDDEGHSIERSQYPPFLTGFFIPFFQSVPFPMHLPRLPSQCERGPNEVAPGRFDTETNAFEGKTVRSPQATSEQTEGIPETDSEC